MRQPTDPAAAVADTLLPTLNIVGAGKLGSTLGRLWAQGMQFALDGVVCRTVERAHAAVAFIEAGRPMDDLLALRPADVTLIATPDDQIGATCAKLAALGKLRPGAIVMHCSGVLGSNVLDAAKGAGCATASVHPLRSFADPRQVAEHFAGTWCSMEGDAQALASLAPRFEAIGAQRVDIDPAHKPLYHAAAVFASNYLVTLLDLALSAYVQAGIPRATAMSMIAPLACGSIENVLAMGPQRALTGPAQRGDLETIALHEAALLRWDENGARLYRQLADATATLAQRNR